MVNLVRFRAFIDLVINFLAPGTLFLNSYDTLSYILLVFTNIQNMPIISQINKFVIFTAMSSIRFIWSLLVGSVRSPHTPES